MHADFIHASVLDIVFPTELVNIIIRTIHVLHVQLYMYVVTLTSSLR